MNEYKSKHNGLLTESNHFTFNDIMFQCPLIVSLNSRNSFIFVFNLKLVTPNSQYVNGFEPTLDNTKSTLESSKYQPKTVKKNKSKQTIREISKVREKHTHFRMNIIS